MKSPWLKPFCLFLLILPLSAVGRNYDEGIEYNKLATEQPTQSGDKIEVLEFFWYGCPHCYSFEPALSKWMENKPKNVHFIRVPAPLNPQWMPHTKAYYALELMGEGEKHHEAFFKAMHVDKKPIYSPSAIADFLASQGVDKKAFNDAYNSFAVEMHARKAMQLGRGYKLDGVPALAVNGKYTISATKAGGYKQMIDITNYLINKEAKAAN